MKIPLSIISKVTTLADGCVRLTLDLQETTPTLMAELFTIKQSGELIQIESDEAEPKSKSQRLRAVLYKLWEQEGSSSDFQSYYNVRMEKLIDQIKDKLN